MDSSNFYQVGVIMCMQYSLVSKTSVLKGSKQYSTVSRMGSHQRHWHSTYCGANEASFLHSTVSTLHQWDLPGDCRLKIWESTCVLLTVQFWNRHFVFWYLEGKWDRSLHSQKVLEQTGESVPCPEWCLESALYGTLNVSLMWLTGGKGCGQITRQKMMGPGKPPLARLQ